MHHYPPHHVGGAELLTRRLAHGLTRKNIAVWVLCIESVERGQASSITFCDEQDGEVNVRRLAVTLAGNEPLPLWFNEPTLRAQFDSLLDRWQPELVHLISGYLLGAVPLYAARARNLPTVVTLTDFWFLCPTIQLRRGDGSLCQGPELLECARCLYDERRVLRTVDEHAPGVLQAFYHIADRQAWLGGRFGLPARLTTLAARHSTLVPALNQVNAIVSLTRFVADLHIQNGIDANKIIVKPDCLDMNDFDPIEHRPFHSNEIDFGYIGQITPVKGVDVLLRAFLRLEGRVQKQIRLHIHGSLNAEPSYVNHLRQLAGDSPDIIFHGAYAHRRALSLLNELDILVVPSLWYENSPRVVLESFAARRPVLGSRVGGIAEVVHENVDGLLFERGDVNDLARVLEQVVRDPLLLLRLAANISPSRTMDEDMDAMLKVYAGALGSTA